MSRAVASPSASPTYTPPPTPTAGPTIAANYVWINANKFYSIYAVERTNDPRCKVVKYTATTTIPNVTAGFTPPSAPPGQAVVLTLTQNGVAPPGVYSNGLSTTATCTPGGPVEHLTDSFGVEEIDWYDCHGSTCNKATSSTQVVVAGAQSHFKIVTVPNTELQSEQCCARYNIWEVQNWTLFLTSYTQTWQQSAYSYLGQENYIKRDLTFNWIYSNLTESIYGSQPTTFGIMAHVPGIKGGDDLFNTLNNNVQVNYSVLGPTNVKMTSTTGSVMIAPNPVTGNGVALSFGQVPQPSISPGISWTFSATGTKGANGEISAIQVVNTQATMIPIAGQTPNPPPNIPKGQYWVDAGLPGSFLYADKKTQLLAGTDGSWSTFDAPARGLAQLRYFQRQDQFQTWFVYNPQTPGSIWVPLGYVQWNWAGTATLTGGNWVLSGVSASPNPTAIIPNSYTSIPLPSWPNHLP